MLMRRVICAFLAALMLFGVLSVGAVYADAASNMTTSERAVELLKNMEGFVANAYRDNGQYSIGYGSGCNPADYPNGITEEQADALLRKYLVEMEADINKFATRYNLIFTQNEFDALMLFTYNLGSGWTNSDSEFRTAVINGTAGNDFLYYIARWCKASDKVNVGLIKRRLAEADLYLNGYYSTTAPSNYSYVLFDTNGGICDVTVHGYDASVPVAVRATPNYTGHRFLGWYTAKEGGKWITNLDNSTKGLTLYAHWQKVEAGSDDAATIQGTAAAYTRYVGQKGTTVYAAPVATAETVKTVASGTSVSVVADYVDAAGVKWGKLSEGGWVNLSDSTVSVTADNKPDRPTQEEKPMDPVSVVVTSTYINVRRGPGTANDILGKVYAGEVLSITDVKTVGTEKWGKFNRGWVSLIYTNYDAIMENVSTNTGTVIATGVVKNCGGLRIRSEAGTNSTVLGNLSGGMKVQITQIKNVNNQSWGRISSGWICLDYVTVTMLSTGTGNNDQTGTPDSGSGNTGSSDQTTGTVISNNNLNIRKGAGTTFTVVGSYPRGTKLVILEQITLNGEKWGRTDKGWVNMLYVRLDTISGGTEDKDENSGNTGSDNTGSGNAGSDTTLPATGDKGVVTCDALNYRNGAGVTSTTVLGYLPKGTEVVILEKKMMGNVAWGRIDKGWICLSYVKLETADGGNTGGSNQEQTPGTGNENTGNQGNTGSDNTGSGNTGSGNTVIATGKIINANSLRIRSAASSNATVVGGLTMGDAVEIYELKQSEGMLWGRIDKGWISMNYVKMNASGNNQVVMTGVITTGLNIRSAAGTKNAIVGSYTMGAKVDIYETATVNGESWGRTDKGWICLVYVK